MRITGRITRVFRDLTAAAGTERMQFEADLTFGDQWTDDGRLLDQAGAVIPAGPLPLQWMNQDDHGTGMFAGLTSVNVGHIDRAWWDGSTLKGEGTFATHAAAQDAAEGVDSGDLRGVSVDTFPLEWEITVPISDEDELFWFALRGKGQASLDRTMKGWQRFLAGNRDGLAQLVASAGRSFAEEETDDDSTDDEPIGEIVWVESLEDFPKTRFLQWKLMGATLVPFPAFDDAHLRLKVGAEPGDEGSGEGEGEGGDEAEAITASGGLTAGGLGLVSTRVPERFFREPEHDVPTPLTITAEGQVYGHAFLWDECHTAYGVSMAQGKSCIKPPRSHHRYAYYQLGGYMTEEEREVYVGAITLGTVHAKFGMDYEDVRHHYEDTGVVAAYATMLDGKLGGWYSGCLSPSLTEEQLVEFRASKMSGDWRNRNGKLELMGLLGVNIPGFPIARMQMVASGGVEEIVALVSAGSWDSSSIPSAEQSIWKIRGRAAALARLTS